MSFGTPTWLLRNSSGMIEQYPQISDIHFWAQFPGESVEAGDRRLKYIAEKVLLGCAEEPREPIGFRGSAVFP